MRFMIPTAPCWLLLIAVLLLAGCPSGEGKSGSGTKDANSDTTVKKQADSTAETPPVTKAAAVKPSRLEFSGFTIGMDVATIRQHFEERGEDFTVDETWAEEDITGIISSQSAVQSDSGVEEATFLNGQLVGFNVYTAQEETEFNADIAVLTGRYGEPTTKPSEWFLSTKLGASMDPDDESLSGGLYWEDPDNGALMVAFFEQDNQSAIFGVMSPDAYVDAMDATMAVVFGEPGAPIDAPDVAVDTSSMVPMFGFTELELDTVTLAIEIDELSERYVGSPMMTYNVWVVEDETGMLGANPQGMSPYPAEAANFINNQLVSFMQTVEDTPEEYADKVIDFNLMFGDAQVTPPEWALDSPFLAGRPTDGEAYWWSDEDYRAVLLAQYDSELEVAAYMLLHVDNYPLAEQLLQAKWDEDTP